MLPIDMQALPAWLSQQRWFGGKGAKVAGVRDLDRAQLSPGLLLSAVEVRYAPPRPPESYALALRPWTGKGGIVEGLDDDAARGPRAGRANRRAARRAGRRCRRSRVRSRADPARRSDGLDGGAAARAGPDRRDSAIRGAGAAVAQGSALGADPQARCRRP